MSEDQSPYERPNSATYDSLTQLLDRRTITRMLDQWCEHKPLFTLAMFDLDHFKRLNDEHGHAIGDAALVRAAEITSRNLRPDDVAGRYGGEEFLIMLPDVAPEAAYVMLEDLRRTLSGRPLELTAGDQTVEVELGLSGGIAGLPRDGRTAQDILRAADEALYQAKVSGRGRLVLATSQKMRMKSSYYTTVQLERLTRVARATDRSESFLLREALDELLYRYEEELRAAQD